jgi:hypothetical protein
MARRFQPDASIFSGQALPDFVDPLVERVGPGVTASVLKMAVLLVDATGRIAMPVIQTFAAI